MSRFYGFIKNNIYVLSLAGISFLLLLVNIRINIFSYNNFDFGKFDLGNMTQMVWNTLQGRPLYLTDYFGANVPRWSMSHVDPILLLFVPIFALYQHPLTLVVSQLILVLFSSVLIYMISEITLKSKLISFLIGLSYLFYPAVGFLTAKTGFHGVSAVIPFFLGSFYIFEKMYRENKFTLRYTLLLWLLLVLTMSGKEQVPLYVLLYGLFIVIFRNYDFFTGRKSRITLSTLREFLRVKPVRHGLAMMIAGAIWFTTAFFVIIPKYSVYRVDGYRKFADNLNINQETARDVAMSNYFLSRYEDFGDSYFEIVKNIFVENKKAIKIIFSGDKTDNFRMTFEPLLYIPFLYPVIFFIAVPDLAINYLTATDAGGISEITNHRISMIIPALFVSVIFFISGFSRLIEKSKRRFLHAKYIKYLLAIILVSSNLYTSAKYDNPVYLWIRQAFQRRVVHAKSDKAIFEKDLVVGKQVKVSALENRDRECAEKLIKMIPDGVSVSGPDYLGAHLAQRETYAIFPALYNEADYVIVDVFSRKIFTILGLDAGMLKDIVKNIFKNPDYSLEMGCGNIFVYKRTHNPNPETLLPIQERLVYDEKFRYEIQDGLYVVDYSYPENAKRGNTYDFNFVYTKKGSTSLNNYILFLSFVNKSTGDIYQLANLPSFGIKQPRDWSSGKYYMEKNTIVIPDFVKTGEAAVFVGASDTLKSKSIYLGDINIQ